MRNLVFAVLALGVATAAGAGNPVLRVNGVELDQAQIDLAKRAVERVLAGRSVDQPTILRHALDQVIGRTLLVQAARKAGVKEDPSEVDAMLAQQAAQLGGEKALTDALASSGADLAALRRTETEQLLVKHYVRGVLAPEIKVTPDDARAYYSAHPEEFSHPEQWKLRMILVEVAHAADEATVAAARKRAEEALARIKKGEDFATVAKETSTDASATKGGELGWVRKGLLLPEVEPKVLELKPGEVSQVLQSSNGFHIFQLEGKRPAGTYEYEEIGDRLVDFLKERKLQDEVSAKVQELRASAAIQPLTPEITQALAPPHAAPTAP